MLIYIVLKEDTLFDTYYKTFIFECHIMLQHVIIHFDSKSYYTLFNICTYIFGSFPHI